MGRQASRRLILDLHNVTGVLGLPFHVIVSLSGLLILYSIYFPTIVQLTYDGDQREFAREAYGYYERSKLSEPAELASLDASVVTARAIWKGEAPRYVLLVHPGDASAYVQIARPGDDRISSSSEIAYLDAGTGALLHRLEVQKPMAVVHQFISGLHLIQFRHWSLRWVYFSLGLSGCAVIATGHLFWLASRRKRQEPDRGRGVRIFESLSVGSITGILIATLAFFIVNWMLPLEVTFLGESRAALEIWTFYFVWIATVLHAWLRSWRAWIDQCSMVAACAIAAVLLNWITTGDHLLRSLSHRHLWAVAGMDVMLLVGAVGAASMAFQLRLRQVADVVALPSQGEKRHT